MEQIVKVTRNFQVTIPAIIRDKIGLKEGDVVKVIYDEREGVIKNCSYKEEEDYY
jgi:AbrB family looped-hinge helix DNA binding protein